MSNEGYHEPFDRLPESARAFHRAIVSLMEELEAVDWYYQRAAVTEDPALKAILLHNAHEEVEHAMMVLEWVRRQDSHFDAKMRTYLFQPGDILAVEANAAGGGGGGEGGSAPSARVRPKPTATLGSLREEEKGGAR